MNYHYPKTKKHWQEKTHKKRLMENLSKDNNKELDILSNLITLFSYIHNHEFFEMDNILHNKRNKV